MPAQRGDAMTLAIGDGGSPMEHYTTLGGMRLIAFECRSELLDASHVASGAWRLGRAGERAVRLRTEGVFENRSSESRVRQAAIGGTAINARVHFSNGDSVQASFLVPYYEREGAIGGLDQFRMTLESAGAVSYIDA